ncbi:hypothetical protein QFC21_006878 [Naganishia friedmannii]|uniref:Uncharacterized protein n=1 Tax=Naganishia friedmannii TaxID=89922 RepID=A0ACC2V038_9TREE|nr:hypothetical protein QFC21_006878 [Naganishia friedmannii]
MFIARSNVFRAVSKTQQARFISLSAVRSMPTRSQMHESDPKKLDEEKQKHLSGKDQDRQTHPEDAPGWNETLASESEAVVKAETTQDGPPSKELQEKTVKHLHKE